MATTWARGLWGKSTMYEESVGVPLIVKGCGLQAGAVGMPAQLFDLAADPDELHDIAAEADHADVVLDLERELRALCDRRDRFGGS